MTSEKENVVAGSAQPTAKVNRRGISNQTKAVAQLRFHESDAAQNGLFVGHVEEIKVNWSTNADGKQFTGMSVPHFTIHVASNHNMVTERRHAYYTLNPVESNVNTIPNGTEEWKVNNIFNWIKHMLDVFYLKGRELTEEEETALSLPFNDYDEEGNYVSVEPEDVIAGYRFIFENAASMLNGSFNLSEGETAKPTYKTADGKPISCWIKLLRHKKVKGDWKNVAQNGELGFDNFIGNGVIEILKKDCPPAVLRIDFAKESITPKETKKTPTLGVPGIGTPTMGGVVPGNPMDMGVSGNVNAFADASGDMPF